MHLRLGPIKVSLIKASTSNRTTLSAFQYLSQISCICVVGEEDQKASHSPKLKLKVRKNNPEMRISAKSANCQDVRYRKHAKKALNMKLHAGIVSKQMTDPSEAIY